MSEKRVCSFFIGSKLFKEQGTRVKHNAGGSIAYSKSEANFKSRTLDDAKIDKERSNIQRSGDSDQMQLKINSFEQVNSDEQNYVDDLLSGYREIKIETGDLVNECFEQADINTQTDESRKSEGGFEDNGASSKWKNKQSAKHYNHTSMKKEDNSFEMNANIQRDTDTKCDVISKRKRGRPPRRCKDADMTNENEESFESTKLDMTENQENGFDLQVALRKRSKRKCRKQTKHYKAAIKKKRTVDNNIVKFEQSDAKIEDPDNKTDESISCTICGKRLKSIKNLKRHLPIHEKPNYKCMVCGRKCIDERRYEVHMASHTGGKPFCCETCGGCFSSAAYLRSHRRIHTGEKPYFCEFCGKSFRGNPSLRSHLDIHLGIKKHSCDICEKSFYKKSALRRHMLSHTDIRNYQCDICGKYYRQNAALTVHKLIHTGERNYPCPVCGSRFTQNSSVKVHMKIHLRDAVKSQDKLHLDHVF